MSKRRLQLRLHLHLHPWQTSMMKSPSKVPAMTETEHDSLRSYISQLADSNKKLQADLDDMRAQRNDSWRKAAHLEADCNKADKLNAQLNKRLLTALQIRTYYAVGPFLAKCAGVCVCLLVVAKIFVELS